jgi:hypothetical protein
MSSCIRSKPFSVKRKFVEISPFRGNMQLLKEKLEDYHKGGKQIGFTWVSSMKSMGLIPRSDGTYRLGEKYLKI